MRRDASDEGAAGGREATTNKPLIEYRVSELPHVPEKVGLDNTKPAR